MLCHYVMSEVCYGLLWSFNVLCKKKLIFSFYFFYHIIVAQSFCTTWFFNSAWRYEFFNWKFGNGLCVLRVTLLEWLTNFSMCSNYFKDIFKPHFFWALKLNIHALITTRTHTQLIIEHICSNKTIYNTTAIFFLSGQK